MFKVKYFKIIVAVITIVTMFSATLNYASADSFVGEACNGIKSISTTASCTKSNVLQSTAHKVVNIMSIVVGLISVIMLLVAGIKFVTAGGDSNSVQSARNTLIYALIGVFIAVLAQVLVRTVLNTATSIQNNSYLNTSSVIKNDV